MIFVRRGSRWAYESMWESLIVLGAIGLIILFVPFLWYAFHPPVSSCPQCGLQVVAQSRLSSFVGKGYLPLFLGTITLVWLKEKFSWLILALTILSVLFALLGGWTAFKEPLFSCGKCRHKFN